jgi:ribosomal protein L11 methylase PrmA
MMGLEKTKSVVRIFKSVSDGAHANTRGFHGSLTAYSLQKIFHEVDPYGRNFLDIGFGTGVVLAAALTSGAAKAHGFELPENQANQYIFQAAMRRISSNLCHIPDISRRVMLDFKDIVEVLLCNR